MIPKELIEPLLLSRYKDQDGKPLPQVWFNRKDMQQVLDKIDKYLENTHISTKQEST